MGQNILDTDSFGGSNGDDLATYSAHWVAGDLAQCKIAGTPGVGLAGFSNAYNINTSQTWTNDHFSELKVDASAAPDQEFWTAVRGDSSGNAYLGGCWPGTFDSKARIARMDADAITSLATDSGTTISANDVVNLEVVGTTLNLRVNGVIKVTTTDATYASGNPGIKLFSTASGRFAGTWKAGSVTSGSVGAAAGTSAATGVGASAANSPGSAAGVATASGVGISSAVSPGSAAAVAVASGVGASAAASVGAAAGVGLALGISPSTFLAAKPYIVRQAVKRASFY